MKSPSTSSLLALLAVTSLVILATQVLVGEGAGALFGFLVVAFPILLMALGAQQSKHRSSRSLGAVGPILAVLLILLGLSVGVLLALRGRVMDGSWPLGLPAVLWVQLAGFWLLPLLLVGLGYAFTFDSHGLREEDLRRLRQRWGRPQGKNSEEPGDQPRTKADG